MKEKFLSKEKNQQESFFEEKKLHDLCKHPTPF
jgi:hypothetical protein